MLSNLHFCYDLAAGQVGILFVNLQFTNKNIHKWKTEFTQNSIQQKVQY